MRVSFDLDGTLIPLSFVFPTYSRSILHKVLGIEPMRAGFMDVYYFLKANNCQVGIYTTSYRSQMKIYCWMLAYGLKPDFIINEKLNRKTLYEKGLGISKYPPAFEIDVHIDDQKGVMMESDKYDFKILLLDEKESKWKQVVIDYFSRFF
ncbi:HAD family hydrolase [Aureibacter tunicatorum]|uniref:Uncharacterized protein n=1 Tax=Aureibacter tunicatorum TaxID=866807 RepID=A0AAE3XMR7_9BACT|nr:HAD family hydrolase [Aureibacter tunicatorum]MDR6240771.1 hypothetical protein [Aureibacter tunicatorum]